MNNVVSSIYYNVPILAHIEVDEFVEALCNASPESQRIAFTSFRGRYGHGPLQRDLKDELPWLQRLKGALEEAAFRMRPLSRFRILNYMRLNIDRFLPIVGEDQNGAEDQQAQPG